MLDTAMKSDTPAAADDWRRTTTLASALDRLETSGRGITFVDAQLSEEYLAYSRLASGARRMVGTLQDAGVEPGDRVCVLGTTSPRLVTALFAAWRLGAVPVVLSLPRRVNELREFADEVARRVEASGARLLLAENALSGAAPSTVRTLALEEASAGDLVPVDAPAPAPEDLAYLQFTSGSTSQPKAAALTHRQLLASIVATAMALSLEPEDTRVSWLPLYHDMGLIWLVASVVMGSPTVLASPEQFLTRPGMWLDAISRYRGAATVAPNFAYAMAARDLALNPRPLDLSSLRIAVNGAEAVDYDTIQQFLKRAAAYGLSHHALCPAYGLAEATLAVAITRPEEAAHALQVDPVHLEAGHVVPSDGGRTLVSCGRPIPGTEIVIVDDKGCRLSEQHVGEILVRSPTVMSGYWRDEKATADALDGDGWLRTGDLGFLTDVGELVVCGRLKDMVIVGGRNLYPEDYEFWAERVNGVRRGNVIAFALSEHERVIVALEPATEDDSEQLAASVLDALRHRLDRDPDKVVVVRRGSLPKTSSGKRQRNRCRQRYLAGQLLVLSEVGR